MARRRKSNLSVVSAEAKRARLRRALEEEAERAERLLNQRLRAQRSRSLETQEERDYRLFLVRKRSARIRAAQSRKEHQGRLKLHRTGAAARRGKEMQEMQEQQQESGISVGTNVIKKEPKQGQESNTIRMAKQRATKRTDSEQKAERKRSMTLR